MLKLRFLPAGRQVPTARIDVRRLRAGRWVWSDLYRLDRICRHYKWAIPVPVPNGHELGSADRILHCCCHRSFGDVPFLEQSTPIDTAYAYTLHVFRRAKRIMWLSLDRSASFDLWELDWCFQDCTLHLLRIGHGEAPLFTFGRTEYIGATS